MEDALVTERSRNRIAVKIPTTPAQNPLLRIALAELDAHTNPLSTRISIQFSSVAGSSEVVFVMFA